ncbi:hypothetical protein MKI84_17395 [Ancylobacter sp. A5.8]|uniref:hypothetical protein n=1 Tax=Ancylobacter gelatini TaxID=2919920 RepID=UPI001F4EC30D|nr:hypothetical protein [Ancylobacter gelatini]MCJ8144701.1 hypothetical protein [Ancylobacter gelatini]
MKLARLTFGAAAAALGALALSATPGVAQQSYVEGYYVQLPPPGMDDRGHVFVPPERIIIREAPMVVREAPARVIVREPIGGPYANEVYVREAGPRDLAPLPPDEVSRGFDEDCRTVERETRSGLITVSTVCD